ncbi:MAG: NepR family anti-sigma factor [Parasphingorhabdus sp.]|nr:NepR family anti-sigma factor [Parasphingorhabdus sp.]
MKQDDKSKKAKTEDHGTARGEGPAKGRKVIEQQAKQNAIGAGLRSLYHDVVREPLPDDIARLLDMLEDDDATKQRGKDH